MHKQILCIVFLVISSINYGQAWEFVYDSIPSMGRQIIITNDSNYLVTGVNNGFEDDNLSIKLDRDGNILWMSPNGGYAVTQTYDNKYVFAGSNSPRSVLKKIDESGNLEWYKTYGLNEEYFAVIESSDSSIVSCGVKYYDGDSTFLVRKTDSDGNLIWTTRFFSMYHNGFRDIIEFDHHYYLVGRDYDDNYPPFYLFIAKVTMSGVPRWQKLYEIPGNMKSIAVTHDSALMVAGGNLLVRLNLEGDTIWTKQMYPSWDIESVAVTAEGGFIVSGCDPYPYYANLLAELDSLGNWIWQKEYPTLYTAYWGSFTSVACTEDGGFIACGFSEYANKSTTRLRVIKTDETGSILVGTSNLTEPRQNIIHPNPTDGRFKIDLEDVQMVEIYDACGSLITISQHNQNIDVSTCISGVYIARILTGNGVVSHKIIKK